MGRGTARDSIQDNGLKMQGPPLTITTSYDASGWKFDAGIPVERR
jgi:hypothetical protein